MKQLNIRKLIRDMGGARKVAEICGVQRTAPYGWIRQKHIRSTFLEKLKSADPDLNFNIYFEEKAHEQRKLGSST